MAEFIAAGARRGHNNGYRLRRREQMHESASPQRLLLPTAVIAAICFSSPARASDVSEGLKHYNAGKFETAKVEFERALKTHKEDPRLHYCLANTLMRMHKVPEALQEYHLSMHYGEGTIIAEESEAAIKAYERHAEPFDREKGAAARQADEGARIEEQRQRSAEIIHRQAAEGNALRAAANEGQRNSILSRATENAKKIVDQGEEDANSASYTWRRRYWARGNADAIRKQAKSDSEALLQRAKHQAEAYDREVQDRQNRMSEAESNLNDQMLRPISGGKMRLVPEGTNLYIRNYK